MLISPNLKIASAVIGVGGVATGAGVGIYHSFIKSKAEQTPAPINNQPSTTIVKQSIASLINKETKVLLVKEQDTENWNNNWATFKKKYNKTNITSSKWSFAHTWDALPDTTAPNVFKDKCLSNSNIEVENTNDELFKEVELYCTKAKG